MVRDNLAEDRIRLWDSGYVSACPVQVSSRTHKIAFAEMNNLKILRNAPSVCKGGMTNRELISKANKVSLFYAFKSEELESCDDGFWIPNLDDSHRTVKHDEVEQYTYSIGFPPLDMMCEHTLWPIRGAKLWVSTTHGGAELHIDCEHQLNINGDNTRILNDGFRRMTLQPGDITIIPAGVPHAFTGPGNAMTLSFDQSYLKF